MKAVVFHEQGGPEVLRYEDLPHPSPAAGGVAIEVRAAGVNPRALFLRRGMPAASVALPKTIRADAAGIIRELGAGVSGLKIGQRVTTNPGSSCGHCEFCSAGFGSQCTSYSIAGEHRDGSYAELLRVPAHTVLPIPDW